MQKRYTVKEMTKLSGVSVRTLHFYDEIGLLKPGSVGDNGYRYYGPEQLLLLQQILFYRELGFPLGEIQQILSKPQFDKIAALRSHRKALTQQAQKTQELIHTIDKTIAHLTEEEPMKDKDIYKGFDAKKQAEYEKYMKNRYGADNPAFSESAKNVKGWTKADWELVGKEFAEICKSLAALKKKKLEADSEAVQKVIERHHQWLKNFWTPNRESYTGLGMGYTGFEWKQTFEPYDPDHPKLAQFMADAMKAYADRELR